MKSKERYFDKVLACSIRCYVFLVMFITVLRIIGCIDFRSSVMEEQFLAFNLLILAMILYENSYIKNREKAFLFGSLFGNIVFINNLLANVILMFLCVSVLIQKIVQRRMDFFLAEWVSKIFLSCMSVLELYSICIINMSKGNEHDVLILNDMILVDVFFVASLVLFILFDRESKRISKKAGKPRKKAFVINKMRLLVWMIMVFLLVLFLIKKSYMNIEASNEFAFFIGESINRGYVLRNNMEDICYVFNGSMPDINGGYFENYSLYESTPIEYGFYIQKILILIGKITCMILFRIESVIFVAFFFVVLCIYKMYIGYLGDNRRPALKKRK